MKNDTNKISVILPVYNGGKYLEYAVESVLHQDYDDFEFIICDDASSDGSYSYLDRVTNANPGRITLLKNPKNLGLFKTLNKMINQSNAGLIHLWSQDDIMKPNCLQNCIAFHRTYPNISMSYHGIDYINENGEQIIEHKNDGTPEVISSNLYANISIRWGCIAGNIANVTLNRRFLEEVGLFNEDMKVSGDFDLWTRLATLSDIGRNKASLIFLRVHEGQLSKSPKSVYLRIMEDIPIHLQILNLLNANDKKIALKWWRWKTQVSYYNDFIFLRRKGETEESAKIYKLLKQNFNLSSIFFKWIFIKLLRILKLEIGFYKNILDR